MTLIKKSCLGGHSGWDMRYEMKTQLGDAVSSSVVNNNRMDSYFRQTQS